METEKPAETAAEGASAPPDAAARRRLDEVFGDVAPAVTTDELGIDEPLPDAAAVDRYLLANRPPHHDRP